MQSAANSLNVQIEQRKTQRHIFFERICVRARTGVYLLPAAEMVNISESGCCIYMRHTDEETAHQVSPKKSLLGCIEISGDLSFRFAGEIKWTYPHANGFAVGVYFFNRMDLNSEENFAKIRKFCTVFNANL